MDLKRRFWFSGAGVCNNNHATESGMADSRRSLRTALQVEKRIVNKYAKKLLRNKERARHKYKVAARSFSDFALVKLPRPLRKPRSP